MSETCMAQTVTPNIPPADERGETVADARRLARKAKRILLRYPCGPDDWQTNIIILTRSAFLTATKFKDAAGRMPCELYKPDPEIDDLWLRIGR